MYISLQFKMANSLTCEARYIKEFIS